MCGRPPAAHSGAMETTTNTTQDTTAANDTPANDTTARTAAGPQGPGYARTPALMMTAQA